jgi:hypothetical protein
VGHFQPRQPRLASGLMSAAGVIAAVRSTDAGSSISAMSGREQMQQSGALPDSLDHLVGKGEELVRHGEAERLCGGQVDDKIELGWLLDRNVGRLGAA